jgi:uncharacterized protein (UPF0332 family)
MPYEWKDFLYFAENLFASPDHPGPQEASMRSSISRAYYAAYHAALDAGERDGYKRGRSANEHKTICLYFKNSRSKIRKKISSDLWRLRKYRNQADYDNELESPIDIANHSISLARTIFANIEKL